MRASSLWAAADARLCSKHSKGANCTAMCSADVSFSPFSNCNAVSGVTDNDVSLNPSCLVLNFGMCWHCSDSEEHSHALGCCGTMHACTNGQPWHPDHSMADKYQRSDAWSRCLRAKVLMHMQCWLQSACRPSAMSCWEAQPPCVCPASAGISMAQSGMHRGMGLILVQDRTAH